MVSTKGIVLHSFKYSDTSVIARIFTRELGLQSYLVPGVRKASSRIKANLFQHFSLVEMVVYHKEKDGLQRIKEIRMATPTGNITGDIRKSTMAMFLSEILLGTFRHQEPHQQAFDFVFNAILRLDMLEENIAVYHIIFLLQLSKFLGFAPSNDYTPVRKFFNLSEGFYQEQIDYTHPMDSEVSNYFYQLSQASLGGDLEIKIPSSLRKSLLTKVVDFYRLHLEGLKEIKSLQVLEVVFQ